MTATNWNKFVLLMWKNWRLQWRYKFQAIIGILIPVLFSALLVIIRSFVRVDVVTNATMFQPISINDFHQCMEFEVYDMRLAYSPKNDALESLITNSSDYLGIENPVVGLLNANELEDYINSKNSFAGIQFDDSLSDITELPNNLEISIRFPAELRCIDYPKPPDVYNWRTDLLFPHLQNNIPRNNIENVTNSDGFPAAYIQDGFLHVQNAISKVFIESKSNITVPDIYVQRFPYAPYRGNSLSEIIYSVQAILILLSFVFPCINTVKFITHEKEKNLKEAMKIMGLPNWLHWTSWFIKSLIYMTITITLIVALIMTEFWYKDPNVSVYTYSDWTVIWFFFFIYSIVTIMYCFMMSTFFSTASTAAGVAAVFWFLFYTPYSFTESNYGILSLSHKLSISLFSNSAMGFGIDLILRHEGKGVGLQWNNLFSPVSPDDSLSVGLIIVMMLVSSIIYLLITLYVEKVNPGEFGISEKWYFPFTKKFWCYKNYYEKDFIDVEDICQNNPEHIESDPIGMRAGIKIKDLRKVYSNKKIAVHGLTMNMFEDQITVLLGHNGAGKTTTMSMLTGMFPATSGNAIVNNKDIRTDIDGVRSSFGLCTQHNILFDELTVREHIIFYSKLKNLPNKEIENEINKYVDLLELRPKINSFASTLSGGMQRKLSVAVALCGKSKVVLLDEPTSGMDPAARRFLWDLLQQEKKGRTILMSTHFMDEADILGDRIAIMCEGELKASGSPFFLKKKFGIGYHLICLKEINCNVSRTTSLLQKYVHDIQINLDTETELSSQLSEKYASVFEVMLKDLEDHSYEFGISGYGLSLTTLEDVFMKIGSDEPLNSKNLTDSVQLLQGSQLTLNQIIAMFQKKFCYAKHHWVLLFLQIILPVIYLALTVMIVQTFSDLPSLKIELGPYETTVTVLEIDPDETTDSLFSNIGKSYASLIEEYDFGHELETIESDMETYILSLGETIQPQLNAEYLAGATIKEDNITLWFNNQAYHTSPLTLNLFHNAMLKASNNDCSISITNDPLPFSDESKKYMSRAGTFTGFQLALNTGIAMAFMSAFYIIFYIKERVTRAKLLQYVSGVKVFTFWMTAYIWDFVTFLFTTIFIIIILAIFNEDGWSSFDELGRIFLLLISFGFSVLPFTYLASMLFTVPSTGFTRMAVFNIITGIAFFILVFIMSFQKEHVKAVSDKLTWIFFLFPHFSLNQGLNSINIMNINSYGWNNQSDNDISYFKWEDPGIGRNITFLYIMGIVTFGILMLLEYGVISSFINKYKSTPITYPSNRNDVDTDVLAEKNKIKHMSIEKFAKHNLILDNITKFYKDLKAVYQISVGIPESECFGLLGVNGAGKTSLFKMLTGDEIISDGEAWVKGINLRDNMNKVHQFIGYCPQFDALIEDLTGRETLGMFCLLRGIPRNSVERVSLKLATDLNFMKHIDKKVQEYSGGNKRKLSTAVALIGNPSVVYLDEPTTGLDPISKRQLWNMICKVRNTGKSIILTSHSMEECEALCTRLAIMVNGEFKCIGSTQYLKNKFSKGFILTLKIKKTKQSTAANGAFGETIGVHTNLYPIKEFISKCFIGSVLKEEIEGMLTYYIPSAGLKWSQMFGIMERGKAVLNIEDYSLSQTSLEQVFLSFTKYQSTT